MPVFFLLGCAVTVLILYRVKGLLLTNESLLPLPPGPPRKPIIGNLNDLPVHGEKDWLHWLKHKDLYGPISSLSVFGQTLVILNDARLAFELMQKRSTSYSDRPRTVFASEIVGWEKLVSLISYNDRFRAMRKAMARCIGSSSSMDKFHPLQEVEIHRVMLRILNKPEELMQHMRKGAGAVILKVAYGYTVEPHEPDPLVDLADHALQTFSLAATPGVWLVDFVPQLKYIPWWFPGAGFQKTARAWRQLVIDMVEKPYKFVTQQMAEKNYQRSFLSDVIDRSHIQPGSEEELVAKWSAAAMYSGGSDTTISSMACFFLTMILYPEVQRKAQEEIDRVVGNDRLPGFADRTNLPYIDAIVKEVLRWHAVAPLALPHVAAHEDTIDGYRIPKGALVIPNIWGFLRDRNVFHDPETFKPERFLGDNPEPDPHLYAFGFGRRICPGRMLADATIYIAVAQFLAAFNISRPVRDGRVVDIDLDFTTGVISHPAPFGSTITPRSPAYEELIRAVEHENPWEASHSPAISM